MISNTSTYFPCQSLRNQRPSAVSSHFSRHVPSKTVSALGTTMAASDANSSQQVQRIWHILPDGTKLEVLMLTRDHVRHSQLAQQYMQAMCRAVYHTPCILQEASCVNPPVLMLHGAGHAAWCYKVGLCSV